MFEPKVLHSKAGGSRSIGNTRFQEIKTDFFLDFFYVFDTITSDNQSFRDTKRTDPCGYFPLQEKRFQDTKEQEPKDCLS